MLRLILTLCCICHATGADVFLVTGQSNVKVELFQGIEDTLRESGRFPDLKVVWARHSGRSLDTWYDTAPRHNYAADFFALDGSGSGLVESAMNEGGGPHTFRGFFWFQGESDTHPDGVQHYHRRFTGMLNRLSEDLGKGPDFANSGARYHLAIVDSRNVDPEPIRSAQRNMVAEHTAVAGLIDTRDYLRWDGVHVLPELLYDLGRRMANQYLTASGHPPVLFDNHWIGTGDRTWSSPANWQAADIPASDTFRQNAMFGYEAKAADGEVIVGEAASIDGLSFSGASGIGYWRLTGPGPLTLNGDIDVRGTAVELDLPLKGTIGITGRGAYIALRGKWQGTNLHLGSHGSPANVYQISTADCFAGGTGILYLGAARIGATHGTKIRVDASQTVSCTTRIERGYTVGTDEAVVTLRNGAIWTQTGGKPLQLGISNSTGNAPSSGALVIGESASQSGALRVMSGSACEVGASAGIGRIEVRHGLCRFEGGGQSVHLGGATYRSDLEMGGGGTGHLRIRPGGTVETARGFISKRILPASGPEIKGSGILYLAGGTLRLIDGASTASQPLDLCGSETSTSSPVRLVLEQDTTSIVDTNGFETICHPVWEGGGKWIKTGDGSLRITALQPSFPSTRIEQGGLVFDKPLNIAAGTVMELVGGMLSAPSIHNDGTLVLRGQALIGVTGEFINRGTLDTTEWNGTMPAGFDNDGSWLQRNAPQVEATRISNGRFIIEMQVWADHRYRLEQWNPEPGTWSAKGADILFDGTTIQFSLPLETSTGIFRVAVTAVEP